MRHAVSHAPTPKWQMSSLHISAAHASSSAAPDDSVCEHLSTTPLCGHAAAFCIAANTPATANARALRFASSVSVHAGLLELGWQRSPAAALWWCSGASALLDSGTAARAMRQLPNTVGAAARMLCRSLRLMRAAKAPPHLVEPAVASAAAPAAGGARSSPTAHPGAEEYRPRCWTGSARCEILGALPAGANRASLVRGKLRLRVRRCARARTPARHRSTCGACGASSVAGKERAPRWSCLDTAARGQRRWRSRREQEFCRAVFVVGRVQ